MKITKRLFDTAPYAHTFEARVVSCERADDGYEVVLDRTLFFPEEGGQSADTGKLGAASVTNVREAEGVIYHRVATPFSVGACVCGEIDFAPRFRKMQNHTGEHILSSLALREFGLANVGFHLGSEDATADFDGELSREQVERLERLANEIVFECHPVRGYYPEKEMLSTLTYRSKLALLENVRLVEIEGVDLCACCAPHVANTGEIGLIKILDCVRYKGGVRLHLRCGFDALESFDANLSRVKKISAALSVKRDEIVDGVERLLSENGALRGEIAALRRELMAEKLKRLERVEGNLCLFEVDGDPNALRHFVNEAKERCTGLCALFWGSDEAGYRYIVASKEGALTRELAAKINAAIDGRGGGSAQMVQGSCTAKKAEIKAFFENEKHG